MATYNGLDFIEQQVDSILRQRGVDVRLFIADDDSTDGTREWVHQLAKREPRVTLVSEGVGGSAPKNFLRIATHAPLADADAVAFVDQDDIWFDDKLTRQWSQLAEADAVSSNVLAFFADRKAILIDKAQPQRRYDFVCESAGPGCTFLLRRAAFDQIMAAISDHILLPKAPAHDWLFYAAARVLGLNWHIDAAPTMAYRQHQENVLGANIGAVHALNRARHLLNGSFREQCRMVARICSDIAAHDTELARIAQALEVKSVSSTRTLTAAAPHLRRRGRDRAVLMTLIASGLF